MEKEEIDSLKEWINGSEDTNEYCERSIIVAALKAAEEGNYDEAARRLRQIIPSGYSRFVDPPIL